MSNQESTIEHLISSAEHIGTIGSPSSTSELSLDILGTAVGKKLVGELALFGFSQDGKPHYALGQITEVQLRNIWLEDPTMRSLARQRGQVNPVSGQQDTHLGQITVSAVFSDEGNKFEQSMLGTVPATGTPIYLATDHILDKLLERYKDEIFYLGHVYGSTPKLPFWFKHFGIGPRGAGEAYHIGIFGKTGSGKSVLAKMIVLAYSRYKDMGIFILDPQGEFARGLKKYTMFISGMENILCNKTLSSLQKPFKLYDLDKIALDRWSLFAQILMEFRFFFELGIKSPEYQEIAADYVKDLLKNDPNITFESLNTNVLFLVLDYLNKNIQRIYGTQTGIDRVREFISEYRQKISSTMQNKILEIWNRTVSLFQPTADKRSPQKIIEEIISPDSVRPIVIIDLSKKPQEITQFVWDEKIKPLIIECFLSNLVVAADHFYKEGKSLNTLVIIDEAHRLAPRGKLDNEKKEKVRSTLIDAVRTTRKYGLGWLFISQTLSSLDKEIIEQLRINFFGFGLSMGTEFQALKELVGGIPNALKLYQSFRDPHSAFESESKQYNFMTIGPVSPLSFAGTPLFLTAFNTPDDFLRANGIKHM
ncbi:MAG: ATP-binding protein [candidate division WOR-3 bacterium]